MLHGAAGHMDARIIDGLIGQPFGDGHTDLVRIRFVVDLDFQRSDQQQPADKLLIGAADDQIRALVLDIQH